MKKKTSGMTIVLGIAFVGLASVVLFRGITGGGAAPVPEAFADSPSLDAAQEAAGAEGKVVFAVATADWCPPCQSYKRNALADERVAAWLRDNAVPVYVDVDASPEAAQTLGVRSIPASFVLSPEGEVLDSFVGALGADALLERLGSARGG